MHTIVLAGGGEEMYSVGIKMSVVTKIAREREHTSLLVLGLLLD